jgi:hypothetical protein
MNNKYKIWVNIIIIRMRIIKIVAFISKLILFWLIKSVKVKTTKKI